MMSADTHRSVLRLVEVESKSLEGEGKLQAGLMPLHESAAVENLFAPTTPNKLTSSKNGGGGLSRTKSHFTMSSSSGSSLSTAEESDNSDTPLPSPPSADQFGHDVRVYCQGSPESPDFDTDLRKTMEPHIRKARLMREKARIRPLHAKVDDSIASSMGVPYTALRHERPFLFDDNTHPLHKILAETLNVEDLSRVHEYEQDKLLLPLLDASRRLAFHAAYDSFVTSFCIPLLHSMAMAKNIFHTSSSDYITYRYQAFPTIRIVPPGSSAYGPFCDSALGHSIGYLTFHIPLTPSFGTNALHVESHPGREDWHPLTTKSVGLGYLFDGARCLHFGLENTTSSTRVSLDFRVLMYHEAHEPYSGDGLCDPTLVDDRYSQGGSSFYDEARIDLARSHFPGMDMVVKKNGDALREPDRRVGPPFA